MPELELGDLVLYPVGPASRWLSRLVGWGQRAIGQAPTIKQYSHVAIVGPNTRNIYEAYWPFIRISPLDLKDTEIYRINGLGAEQRTRMMAYCQSQVGKLYDMLAIVTFGMFQIGGTEVCSQLAYNAGLAAGVVLYPPEALESPDDIAASTLLTRIL
jgi:uncharacterized protein YycO